MQLRPRQVIEFFEILWRRKKVLFLMTLAMLIATYLIIRRVPALYESRALVVITKQPQTPEEQLAIGTPFSIVIQNMKSRATLAKLVREHKLYPEVKDMEASMARLDKAIKLDIKNRSYYPEGPESVTITYRYSNAATAQKVVSDLVSNFDQANQTLREEAATEVTGLTRKIAEVEERLKRLSPQRDLALIRREAANRNAIDTATKINERVNIETTVASLGDREFALERQINDQKRQIAEQEKVVKEAGNPASPVSNAALGALLVRKTEIQAQLNEFAKQYTDKNPKVIATRDQLNEINKQIARMESAGGVSNPQAVFSPEARELKRMQQDLTRLETDLEVTRRDLNRKSQTLQTLPNVSARSSSSIGIDDGSVSSMSETNNEYDRLLSRYNWLLDRQDKMSKVAGLTSSGEKVFETIDRPNLPLKPASPNLMLLRLLALGVSTIFGLLVAVAIELPRMFLLNDERDIQYFLGAPVLALIPETMTGVERGRDRKLRWTRGLVFFLLAAILIPVLSLLIDRTQIFQFLGSR